MPSEAAGVQMQRPQFSHPAAFFRALQIDTRQNARFSTNAMYNQARSEDCYGLFACMMDTLRLKNREDWPAQHLAEGIHKAVR